MVLTTNFDISSADESSADNGTSQGASMIGSQSPARKPESTPFSKRYQRTRSYDDAYYTRPNQGQPDKSQDQPQRNQRSHPKGFKIRNAETAANTYFGADAAAYFDPYRGPYNAYYGSGYVYPQGTFGYPPPFDPPAYGEPKMGTLMFSDQRRRQQLETLYRSTPLLNYGANSYFGWHQRTPATPTLYRNRNPNAADSLVNPFPVGQNGKTHPPPLATCTPDGTANTTGSILFEKETVSPFFNDHPKSNGQKRKLSSAASFCARSLGTSSIIDHAQLRRNRIKLCIIVTILIIVVAVLVAMGIAVYSQIKTQNSVVKLIRQYRTAFIVTGGRQLDYDADLLNSQSPSFKTKAKEFERKVESVFRDSGLASIYEGVEVTGFRFVVEPPGMEVQFNIKIKVNVQLQVSDILAVMDDAIRHNVNGAFQDTVIDPKSLSVENQRLSPGPTSPSSLRRRA